MIDEAAEDALESALRTWWRSLPAKQRPDSLRVVIEQCEDKDSSIAWLRHTAHEEEAARDTIARDYLGQLPTHTRAAAVLYLYTYTGCDAADLASWAGMSAADLARLAKTAPWPAYVKQEAPLPDNVRKELEELRAFRNRTLGMAKRLYAIEKQS